MRASDMHRVAGAPLVGAELRQLVRRHDRRAIALGQRDGIAQVIAMAVGQQNTIESRELVRSDIGGGITGEEGIDDDPFAVPL